MNNNKKFRKYRNELGLTLRDVAKATGLSHVTIYNIENGRVDTGYKKIQKLVKFKGVICSFVVGIFQVRGIFYT